MTTRQSFAAKLTERNAIDMTPRAFADLQAALNEALIAEAKRLLPRARKMDVARAIKVIGKVDLNRSGEISAPFRAQAEERSNALHERRDAIEVQLRRLAEECEIERGDWRLFFVAWSSAYNSQGFGACKYAEGSAQSHADVARAAGVEVEIRKTGQHYTKDYGVEHADFEVWVAVASDLDVEILKRRPPPTLREQVRLSWERGVNPRVYNPYLPHGYEEANGLDFFGGEVKP